MLSVVLTCYNRGLDQVLPTLYSLRGCKVILVNDNPGQNSDVIARAKSLLDDITVCEPVNNIGLAGARNLGASYAKTKYITFLDDDDLFRPERILVTNYIEKNNLEACFFANKIRTRKWTKIRVQSKPFIQKHKFKRNLFGNSLVIKLDTFKRLKGYDTNLRAKEDYDLGLRVLQDTEWDVAPYVGATIMQIERVRMSTNIRHMQKNNLLFFDKWKSEMTEDEANDFKLRMNFGKSDLNFEIQLIKDRIFAMLNLFKGGKK